MAKTTQLFVGKSTTIVELLTSGRCRRLILPLTAGYYLTIASHPVRERTLTTTHKAASETLILLRQPINTRINSIRRRKRSTQQEVAHAAISD